MLGNNGGHGGKQAKKGKNGSDIYIDVPLGTVVYKITSGMTESLYDNVNVERVQQMMNDMTVTHEEDAEEIKTLDDIFDDEEDEEEEEIQHGIVYHK